MSEFERVPVTVLELDLDRCANTYGVLPCTASGGPGEECYNTWQSCQDKPNYVKTTFTPEILLARRASASGRTTASLYHRRQHRADRDQP